MGVLKSAAVKKLWQGAEARMPKVISAETHGILDYLQAATFLGAAAYFWKRDRKAGAASLAVGAFLLSEALLTDYPLGVKPVLSFAAHGKLDRGFTAFALSAPRTLELHSEAATRFYQVNAVLGGLVTSMTNFSAPHAHPQSTHVQSHSSASVA
jgi:hypothetical protein